MVLGYRASALYSVKSSYVLLPPPTTAIDVSPQYFRPQTISVSQLFLQVRARDTLPNAAQANVFTQIFAYIIGRFMEEVIPGPGENARFKTRDNRFWRSVVMHVWRNGGS